MAITGVDIQWGGRTAAVNEIFARRYTVTYLVTTDTKRDGGQTVLSAFDATTGIGIPSIGSTYRVYDEIDLFSWCQTVEAKERFEGHGLEWDVTAQFGPWDPSQFGPDPMLWPIRVWFQAETFERVVWFDVYGEPITNSAGDRFDDPITIDDARTVMIVTRNELVRSFTPSFTSTYNNTINTDEWNGFPSYSVKCGVITTSEPQTAPDGSVYYTVTYPFTIDRNLWRTELLDQGLAELDTSSPPRQTQIVDANKQPVGEAVPLDGAGKRLATNAAPVALSFDVYDERIFADLNIDLSRRYGA